MEAKMSEYSDLEYRIRQLEQELCDMQREYVKLDNLVFQLQRELDYRFPRNIEEGEE